MVLDHFEIVDEYRHATMLELIYVLHAAIIEINVAVIHGSISLDNRHIQASSVQQRNIKISLFASLSLRLILRLLLLNR